HRTDAGEALTERITLAPPDPSPADRVLLRELIRKGKIVGREPLSAARARHQAVLAELPAHALQLARGYPAIPTVFDPGENENSWPRGWPGSRTWPAELGQCPTTPLFLGLWATAPGRQPTARVAQAGGCEIASPLPAWRR